MLKIGLTGGIGSGKSAAAKYFAKFKVPIIDSDKIAHECIYPKSAIYKKILFHFGDDFLTTRKFIDRKKLRDFIFSHKKERVWLEKLLHPTICNIMQKRVAKIKAPYCVMIIPLLFETRFPIKVDRILVIDCPQKLQIERMRKRDNSNTKQTQAIIETQVSRDYRLKNADDIIYNNSSLKCLQKAVKILHICYLSIAKNKGL